MHFDEKLYLFVCVNFELVSCESLSRAARGPMQVGHRSARPRQIRRQFSRHQSAGAFRHWVTASSHSGQGLATLAGGGGPTWGAACKALVWVNGQGGMSCEMTERWWLRRQPDAKARRRHVRVWLGQLAGKDPGRVWLCDEKSAGTRVGGQASPCIPLAGTASGRTVHGYRCW